MSRSHGDACLSHYHTRRLRLESRHMLLRITLRIAAPELLHHLRVREVVDDVLEDGLVVGVAEGPEHEYHGQVRPDVRQLRSYLTARHLAVLVALQRRSIVASKTKFPSRVYRTTSLDRDELHVLDYL